MSANVKGGDVTSKSVIASGRRGRACKVMQKRVRVLYARGVGGRLLLVMKVRGGVLIDRPIDRANRQHNDTS